MKILLIDNNDSFTHNLEHLLAITVGAGVEVRPYTDLPKICLDTYDFAVISPGPGKPSDYPHYTNLLNRAIPLLGICLGLQIINEHFGGQTGQLQECLHGKTDMISMRGQAFKVARYHSLYLEKVAPELEILAVNGVGIPMAARHKNRPIIGYQFHPESFLTQDGEFFVTHAFESLGLVDHGRI
jgi:anthranilate synthase/aminodeoxychorismate synthase-like glutamine amidotransferase